MRNIYTTVKSETEANKFYTVTRDSTGFSCTCPSFKFKKSPNSVCKHISSVATRLNAEYMQGLADNDSTEESVGSGTDDADDADTRRYEVTLLGWSREFDVQDLATFLSESMNVGTEVTVRRVQ